MNKITMLILLGFASLGAMDTTHNPVKMTEFIPNLATIARPLPATYTSEPIVLLNPGAIQKDPWSSSYHAIFTMLAIDKALGSSLGFTEGLKWRLNDRRLFEQVQAAIKNTLTIDKAMDGVEMMEVMKKFPETKQLSLFITGANELMIPALAASVDWQAGMTDAQMQQLLHAKRVEMTLARVKEMIMSLRGKPNAAVHFVAGINLNLHITFSVVTDENGKAKLYVSGVDTLTDPNAIRYINTFLPLVRLFNDGTLSLALTIPASKEKRTEFVDIQNNLIRPLPANLAGKPIVNLSTGAIQRDAWSCGWHAIFNAVAMDNALQSSDNFEEGLKNALSDKISFEEVMQSIKECHAVKAHLNTEQCLNGYDVSETCKEFPLKERLISVFIDGNDKFSIPCLFIPFDDTYPHHGTQEQKNTWTVNRQAELSENNVRQKALELRGKANAALYIIGNLGDHFVNFAIVTDARAKAKLYFVGAWNENINDPRVMKYITKLLPYVEVINATRP